MPDVAPWDIWVVSATTLAKVAYVSNWNGCQFGDQVNDPGHGAVNFDYDEAWLTSFYNDNSEFPWEGNYAVQVYRDGSLVFTFLVEEAEIEYAGVTRRAVMGGRGLAACLEWAIVIPEKYDEGATDPDALVTVMGRAFGSTHTVTTQLETQAGDDKPRHGTMGLPESYHGPKYQGYGGGAFVHLFKEANLGVPATAARWLDTDSTPGGTRGVKAWTNVDVTTLPGGGGYGDRDSDPVDWPLSLSSNLTEQYDSNGQTTDYEWSNETVYPVDDVQWLFSLPTGQNYLQTLTDCAAKTANAQWRVAPNGEISIAKTLGADLSTGSTAVVLTVPQAQRAANSLRRTDLRTSMFISNDFVFERAVDSTAETTYGRREGFVKYDNLHGQSNIDSANQALNEVKDVLDEFTFQYIETDTTRAWADFDISDTVKIEYEPGVFSSRQVVGLSANVTPTSFAVEVTIGEAVDNTIARLRKVEQTEQYSPQITQANASTSAVPAPPLNIVATPQSEGRDRRALVTFDQPKGWENEAAQYEIEVNPVASGTRRYTRFRSPVRGETSQEIVIHGLPSGATDEEYEVRGRTVTHTGHRSEFNTGANFDLAADEQFGTDLDGTIIDTSPSAPGDVSNLVVRGMLNAVLVSFTDLNDGTNLAMQANRGHYEIEISNATSFHSTLGNAWETTVGSDTSGVPGTASQTFVVPSGKGFLCAGLLSVSGGRDHWIRVRAVDWNKEVGNWVYASDDGTSSGGNTAEQWPVVLDTTDRSQTGVIIGTETIWASHIKAGTIDTTRIDTGTLTASNADIGQIFTSAIRMPQPATANHAGLVNDGTTGNEMTFNINHDGDMWWGNYATITTAKAGTNADTSNGTDASTSWIDKTGNAQFVGTISTGAGAPNNILATGNSGEPRMVFGDNAGSLFSGGDSDGGYGYLLGFTGDGSEYLPGHGVFTTETTGVQKYGAAYFVAPRYHGTSPDTFKYAGVRLRDPKAVYHSGTAQGGTTSTIVLASGASDADSIYNDHEVTITSGQGSGQTRTISGYVGNTRTATVSAVWSPAPNGTSIYSVTASDLGEALLVHPADMNYLGIIRGTRPDGGTAYAEVTGAVTAPGGFRITNHANVGSTPGGLTLDSGTPATGSTDTGVSRDKLWNSGGSLMWGATDISTGGSGDLTEITAGLTSGLSVTSGTGPIPDLTLSLAKLADGSSDVDPADKIGFADISAGITKYCTVQDILDLGAGDLTEITVGATSGLTVTNGTGPVPDLYVNANKLSFAGAVSTNDTLILWDVDALGNSPPVGETRKITVSNVIALAPQGTVTSVIAGHGLGGADLSGPIPTLSLDLNELVATTPVAADYAPFIDGSSSVKGQIGTGVAASIAEGTYIDFGWNNTTKVTTVNHEDTSSLLGAQTVSGQHVDSITVDGAGHVTAVGHSAASGGGGSYDHWKMMVTGGSTTQIGDGETVTFSGSGATSVTRSANTIGIYSTNTTYSGGTNVTLSGTSFSLPQSYVAAAGYYNNLTGYIYTSGGLATLGWSPNLYGINHIFGGSGFFNGAVLFNGDIKSWSSGGPNCGTSGNKWNTVYATNGTINTSDVDTKTDIQNTDLGLDFVNALRPVSYKMLDRDGQGGAGVRDHYGFISQEVETLLGGAAATTGLWTNSLIEAADAKAAVYDKSGTLLHAAVPAVEEHHEQGLRYHEFIAPMAKAIQELSTKLDAAEARIAVLEG